MLALSLFIVSSDQHGSYWYSHIGWLSTRENSSYKSADSHSSVEYLTRLHSRSFQHCKFVACSIGWSLRLAQTCNICQHNTAAMQNYQKRAYKLSTSLHGAARICCKGEGGTKIRENNKGDTQKYYETHPINCDKVEVCLCRIRHCFTRQATTWSWMSVFAAQSDLKNETVGKYWGARAP